MSKQPFTPHEVPIEFFNFQYFLPSNVPYPTRVIQWLGSVLHELKKPDSKTPLLQFLILSALMETATVWFFRAPFRFSYLSGVTFTHSLISHVFLAGVKAHVPFLPVQGQLLSRERPLVLMQAREFRALPESQPLFPYPPEQSIICCAEKEFRKFLVLKQVVSMVSMVDMAQLLLHEPTFLTEVTAPLDDQSTVSVRLVVAA